MNTTKKINNPAFTCKMCGHCCLGEGGIIVSDSEQKRIAEFLGISQAIFLAKFVIKRDNKLVIKTNEQGFCIFSSPKGCSIHSVKPDICLAWPYFRGNIVDKISWSMASTACPGINTELGHEAFCKQALEYLQKNKLLKQGSNDEAGALNLKDILTKNEPE